MRAPTPSWFWELTAVGFGLLVAAILLVSVSKVVGIVVACIAAVLFLFLKNARYQQLRNARRSGR